MTCGGRNSPESVPINELKKINTSFEQRETNSSIHFFASNFGKLY
jgi:hypothetical protein